MLRTSGHRPTRRSTLGSVAIVVALTSCGGGSDDPGTEPAAGPTSTGAVAATEPTTPPATDPPATVPPATVPPTTEPAPRPVVFDLAELPAAIETLETDVATGDPLAVARLLGGFPLEVPVPAGSTLTRFDTDVDALADGGLSVEFGYAVIAPGATVPDIDITLDDNGPGSVQIVEIWDPIMTALGFDRTASTASDPGDPGGPNSVNHVYVPGEAAPTTVNGVPADVGNVFVWSTEDVTGAVYGSNPTDPLGGYRVDVDADLGPGAPIPVPLLAAIVPELPLPDTVTFDSATVRLESRSETAYEIDRGAVYLDVYVEWTAAEGVTTDDLAAFYADPSIVTGDVLRAAEPSFFDEGVWEPAELSPYGDADYRLPILVLDRYEGRLGIEEAYTEGDPASVWFRITLNPTDLRLTAPTD